MRWYRKAAGRWADFHGRSPRAEYWTFILVNAAVEAVLMLLAVLTRPGDGGLSPVGPVLWIFSLVVLVPSVAVGVRRLHDVDRSGWWLLLALVPVVNLVLLVLLLLPSTWGPNRHGYDPRLDVDTVRAQTRAPSG